MTTKENKSETGLDIYLRLLHYVRPYWLAFVISTFGFVLYAISQTGFAALMEYLVDAIGNNQKDAYIFGPLTLVGIAFMRGIGTFTGNYFISYVARNLVHIMRTSMFDHLLNLPMDYFYSQTSGHILSKISFNVEQVTKAATHALKISIREGLTVTFLMFYLFYLNWKLSLVFIGTAPFITLVVIYASRRFRRLGHRIQNSMGSVTHAASEAIQGIPVVRTFGGEDFERNRFRIASNKNREQSLKMAFTESISTPVVQLIISIALALLIFMALHPLMVSSMTSGEFIAFITAAGLIAKPLRSLTEVNAAIQQGIAASESIFSLLDSVPEKDKGECEVERTEGQLQFQQVDFSYSQDISVLKQINLDIPAGQILALVGRSGSGKSTLVNLIPRFYDASSGTILLDGKPINEYALSSLRQQIALVTQHVVLFAGSLRDNIAYGYMEQCSEQEIIAAAKAAHVMEFASRLPNGLDTLIGEKGIKLSGGQRQRIAIARAILKNAPILILDEATSALDTESERHIQSAMENVMKGRTTIVIAHRLSTIENADRIVVMDQGSIVEQGNHTELMAKQGIYATLHHMQFSAEIMTTDAL